MSDAVEDKKLTFMFILGVLDYLVDNGLIATEENARAMTDKGIHAFDQLEASGYRPKKETVEECVAFMRENKIVNFDETFANGLVNFVSRWDDLKTIMNDKEFFLKGE